MKDSRGRTLTITGINKEFLKKTTPTTNFLGIDNFDAIEKPDYNSRIKGSGSAAYVDKFGEKKEFTGNTKGNNYDAAKYNLQKDRATAQKELDARKAQIAAKIKKQEIQKSHGFDKMDYVAPKNNKGTVNPKSWTV